MFDWIVDPTAWIALATLTALEIVLGIDNIIFISILVGRLPERGTDSGRATHGSRVHASVVLRFSSNRAGDWHE